MQAKLTIEEAQNFKSSGIAERLATKRLADQGHKFQRSVDIPSQNRPGGFSRPHALKSARPTLQTRRRIQEEDASEKNKETTISRLRDGPSGNTANKTRPYYSVLSQPHTSTRKGKRTSKQSFVASTSVEDEDADLIRYRVNFPKVTPPSYVHSELSTSESLRLTAIAEHFSILPPPALAGHSNYTRKMLTLKSGRGSGRGQVPYAFYMLHNNNANGLSKKRTMEGVAKLILKGFKHNRKSLTNSR